MYAVGAQVFSKWIQNKHFSTLHQSQKEIVRVPHSITALVHTCVFLVTGSVGEIL